MCWFFVFFKFFAFFKNLNSRICCKIIFLNAVIQKTKSKKILFCTCIIIYIFYDTKDVAIWRVLYCILTFRLAERWNLMQFVWMYVCVCVCVKEEKKAEKCGKKYKMTLIIHFRREKCLLKPKDIYILCSMSHKIALKL